MRNETTVKKILPVDLMIEGTSCLVVGGGSIATRKIEHLLEAGALVTVVSRELCADLAFLKHKGRLTHVPRSFTLADLKGAFLVFAATNVETVNQRIIKACQRRGILGCAVDSHWADGNFLTPATLRHPALTLTISTGGQSCRRARLFKDYLSRHLDIALSADLLVLTVRRRGPAGMLGDFIHRIWGVHEFIVVEAGASLEVLAIVSCDPVVELMLRSILSMGARKKPGVVIRRGRAALAYTEKWGQGPAGFAAAERIRGAMEKSVREKWAGQMMRDWLQAAIHKTAPGYNSGNSAHAGIINTAGAGDRDRYELIIRGFQSRNAVK